MPVDVRAEGDVAALVNGRGPGNRASFLASTDYEIVETGPSEATITDPADQPILDATLVEDVGVIVTGNKHVLAPTSAKLECAQIR